LPTSQTQRPRDGTLTLGADTPDVQVEVKFTLPVTFARSEPGKGRALIPRLDELISFTDETLTRFAPLLT
jgi:hypothetical protein